MLHTYVTNFLWSSYFVSIFTSFCKSLYATFMYKRTRRSLTHHKKFDIRLMSLSAKSFPQYLQYIYYSKVTEIYIYIAFEFKFSNRTRPIDCDYMARFYGKFNRTSNLYITPCFGTFRISFTCAYSAYIQCNEIDE